MNSKFHGSLRLSGAVWIALVIAAAAAPAYADDAEASKEEAPETAAVENAPESETDRTTEWEFELAPYLWWSGVKSTVEFGDIESTTDIGFLDAVDHLKFGGLIHAEATNNRWGIMGDVVYLKLGEATEKRVGPGLKLINIDVKADLEQTIFELGGFYRLHGKRTSFDVLAGGRYFGFDTDVEVGPIGLSRDKDWVDPFVGGRFNAKLSERWRFSLRGDVGGFGVGSDLTWNAAAMFRYRIKENMDLGLGYRYLDVKKSSDSGSYDSVTSGPLLGMSIRF